ncbi:hypothetical protein GCL60_09710 [Silvanigrella paludirubra]|uniref:Uncharacterized protein n=1 Tax=Silvanigrella paludirubra TaxID=2499159 RepID=A0A6N6VTY7_9BACT|nr:hypothetical protein [Silvanigrella paludirubra]KAB8039121.1 hypothetical protein GCL60_09710 [Silvanigrella paludirubra]
MDANEETLISDPNEILYRQIHPNHYSYGQIASICFCPNSQDNNKLSVRQSKHVSSKEAFEIHKNILNLKTVGTWGLSVEEVSREALKVIDDSDHVSNKGHAYINFNSLTKNESKKIAQKLVKYAMNRGNLYEE